MILIVKMSGTFLIYTISRISIIWPAIKIMLFWLIQNVLVKKHMLLPWWLKYITSVMPFKLSSWQSEVIVTLPNCFDSFNVPCTLEAVCQHCEMAGVILKACQRHSADTSKKIHWIVLPWVVEKLILWVFLLTDLCTDLWKYQSNRQNNKLLGKFRTSRGGP